jgi:threonine aldolase
MILEGYMYSFVNDYSEGAHPSVLKKLEETNLLQLTGYGEDVCCLDAAALIRKKAVCKNADVHFLPGGTQTNLIAVSAFLRSHEAVLSADTGHIEVHETGAIEATGHKIVTIKTQDGKLSPQLIQPALDFHNNEHMVKPKMVYISNTTEIGTHYNKKELENLSEFCRSKGLLLYLDGARLGSAIVIPDSGLTLEDIAALTDAFYIGGTKNGALLGEALVITKEELKSDFRFMMKQRGGMLAKGRVIGIQFLALFEDDLYFELARRANETADILRKGIAEQGFDFASDSVSNQLFPVFPVSLIEKLKKNYDFNVNPPENAKSIVRLVTSWATPAQAAHDFLSHLENYAHHKA